MRALTTILLLAALLSSSADARMFGRGREGLGMGKLGAAGSKGSNGIPPVTCGTGVIDLSAGCTITVTLGLGP